MEDFVLGITPNMTSTQIVKVEQFVGDTRRLKISSEKAVRDIDWAMKCFEFKAMKCSCGKRKKRDGDLTLHTFTHYTDTSEGLLRKMIVGRLRDDMQLVESANAKEFLSEKGVSLTKYVSSMECVGHPLDEFGILAAAICTGKNVGIMLNAMEFWTTREDNDWENCDIYFAYIGDCVFIPIERLDMSLLNRVAQRVPLDDPLCVKPKRGRKKKSVMSTEETTTGDKEIKNGTGKQKANELKAKAVESASSQPKRRGRKRKNSDDTPNPEIEDVPKGKTRGRKPKKRDEIANAETPTDVVTKKKRGRKPNPPEKENVVKRKRGRPKKCVIIDNINNDDDDDVFCEPRQPKREIYKRESKSKGRVFIKVVTGKNKNGKKGKKHDLETAFNDIDILLENMGMAERSVVGDSNMEECNLQVASTHRIEEGNEKELCQRNMEQIKEESTHDDGAEVTDDIVTDGIVTYGIGTECDRDKKITDEIVTDGIVADEIGSKEDGDKKTTDEIVTDGIVADEIVTDGMVTDGIVKDRIVTDEIGSKEDGAKQIRNGKETGDTDTVAREFKGGLENEITNILVTGQDMEREQPVEEVPDENVTVRVAKFTETNATKEIRENTDSSDTEPLTEKDDDSATEPVTEKDEDRDSTDSTDNTEGAVTIDEDFSKVCSTCPSNPESESSSSSNEKESESENKELEMKKKTEERDGHKKRKRLRMKIKRRSKKEIDYNEETDGGSDKTASKQTRSKNKSGTCDSETEEETEEERKRVAIKYATKNKTAKKKIGKGRKDSLVVKTITITKRKSKKYKCTESGCDEMFDDMKDWVQHINNEHKLEEYSCTICGNKTKSKDKYEKHMMAHEEKQNKWKCTVCSKTFTFKCYLQRHELIHTDEKKYECTDPDCRKKDAGKFKHKADFIRHMEKHSGKRFKCKVCGSVWPSKKDRYEHERSVHRPLKECKNKNCHYSTKDPKMLIKHEMNCKK